MSQSQIVKAMPGAPACTQHHQSDVVSGMGEVVSFACAVHCFLYLGIIGLVSLGIVLPNFLPSFLSSCEGLWWHIGFGSAALIFAALTRLSVTRHLGEAPQSLDRLFVGALILMIGSLAFELALETGVLTIFSHSAHTHHGGHAHQGHEAEFLHVAGHVVFALGNLCILFAHHRARKLISCCA